MKKNNKKHLYVLFLFSGMTAVIYQFIWIRLLSNIYGNSTYSISTIVAGFMLGLALGAWLTGKYIDRRSLDLIKLYAFLELFVGIYGFMSLMIFSLLKNASAFITPSSAGFGLGIVFTGALFLVSIPAFFIGAMLPVLNKYMVQDGSSLDREFSTLYYINTGGAVIGTIMVPFILLRNFSVSFSLFFTSFINILIAVYIMLFFNASFSKAESFDELESDKTAQNIHLILAMLFGFTGLSFEIVFTRVFSMIFGTSIYSFSLILAAILSGIAAGSYVYRKYISASARYETKIKMLAVFQLLLGAAVFGMTSIVETLPVLFMKLYMLSGSDFSLFQILQYIAAFIFMFPVTFLFGLSLPVLYGICRRAADPKIKALAGKISGSIYAANTLGAVAGSLAAGFFLIPALGLRSAMFVTGISGFISAVILFYSGSFSRLRRGIALTAIITFVLTYIYAAPAWNLKTMTSGVYTYAGNYVDFMQRTGSGIKDIWKVREKEKELIYYKDGGNFTVSVEKDDKGILDLRLDGKTDASSNMRVDMLTQRLLAHLPLLLNPSPETALVIGLGSGVTLASMLDGDIVSNVDCVEIEPAVLEASRYFSKYNNAVYDNDKVNIYLNDARAYLLSSKKKYSIISSEPSNPWLSGSARLFTREFFSDVKDHLEEGGVFCMWLQTYRIDAADYKMILATLREEFSHLSLWHGVVGENTLIIASNSDIDYNFSDIQRRYALLGLSDTAYDILARFIMDTSGIDEFIADTDRINSDNIPYFELAGGRSVFGDNTAASIYGDISLYENRLDSSYDSFTMGEYFLKYNMIARAQQEFEISLRDPERRSESYSYLAYVSMHKGKNTLALEYLNAALKEDPLNIKAHINLSELYKSSGDIDLAEECLSKALVIDSNNYIVLNNLADLLLRKGDNEKAINYFERALASNPGFVNPYLSLSYIYKDITGDIDRALEILETALGLGINEAALYYRLGMLYLEKGQNKRAWFEFNRAVALDPAYIEVLSKK